MSAPLHELAAITDAAYQADLARLQAITAEENALRRALDALAQQERANAAADPGNTLALRQIGGDILWTAWVGRKRAALNMQLATVMARKLSAAQLLKRSFGKKSVTEELCTQANQAHRGEQALKSLAEEQVRMVLRAATRAQQPRY